MVFQNYALFPHMNVADNIAYGLRQRNPKPPKQEIAKRVDETLELVRLSGFGKRKSGQTSMPFPRMRRILMQPMYSLITCRTPISRLEKHLFMVMRQLIHVPLLYSLTL